MEWRGVKGTAIIGVPFKRIWRLRTARERWTEPSTPTYQGRRHGFLSGGGGSNRRQGGKPTPKYPKNRKKTPDFGHFILESGGSTRPVFKSAGVRTPPPPVGDAPATYTHSPVEMTAQRGATTGTGSRTLEEEGRGLSAAEHRMAHLASLLLRAEDVETNQGPRFPCGCAAKESATPLCSAARTVSGTTPDVSASRQPTSAASPGSGEPGPAAPAQRRPPRRPRGPEAANPADPTRTPTDTDTTATAANGEERRDPDGGNGTTGAARRPAPPQVVTTGRLQARSA